MKKFLNLLMFVLVFITPFYISAQTSDYYAISKILQATISPENYGANQDVSIEIQSFSYDLNIANINWTIDGKSVLSGLGAKKLTFKTGPIGSTTNVSVTVTPNGGQTTTKSFSFKPSGVTLIPEGDSYVPPFYEGKPLFSYEGGVRIVAFPNIIQNGQRLSSSNLIFKWYKNGGYISDQSGPGKDYVDVAGDIISRPFTIKVEVSNRDGSLKTTDSILLDAIFPEVFFYEKSPIFGTLYNRALYGSVTMTESEAVISATPYNFQNDNSLISNFISWTLNGKPSDTNTDYLTLRNDTGESGTASLSVRLENKNKILQAAENTIDIIFGEGKKSLF